MTEGQIKVVLMKAKRSKSKTERSSLQLQLLKGIHYPFSKNEIESAFVEYVRGIDSLNLSAQYIAAMIRLNNAFLTIK